MYHTYNAQTTREKAFVFFTRGNISLGEYYKGLKEKLIAKGFQSSGAFYANGYDTEYELKNGNAKGDRYGLSGNSRDY